MSIQIERDEAANMSVIADRIRRVQAETDYDYRSSIPHDIRLRFPQINEDYHILYGKNRYAVAKVLQPKTIYEVGIGWGVSAHAFLAGYPEAKYLGIDNGEMGVDGFNALFGLNTSFQMADSDTLDSFVHPAGKIDLIHIDGNHARDHKKRDVVKAILSGAEWLVCDDCHNSMVVAGVFDAFNQVWGASCIPMAFMENSHTGAMLFHTGARF